MEFMGIGVEDVVCPDRNGIPISGSGLLRVWCGGALSAIWSNGTQRIGISIPGHGEGHVFTITGADDVSLHICTENLLWRDTQNVIEEP